LTALGQCGGDASGDPVERRILAAFPAFMAHPVASFHDVVQASVVIREAGEELADGEPFQ
jgi:hypothetical protein